MLFVPVYREDASAVEHRGAFIGWTALAFTADVFFRSALEEVQDLVNLRVYDDGATPGHLMFASDGPAKVEPSV